MVLLGRSNPGCDNLSSKRTCGCSLKAKRHGVTKQRGRVVRTRRAAEVKHGLCWVQVPTIRAISPWTPHQGPRALVVLGNVNRSPILRAGHGSIPASAGATSLSGVE